MLFIAFSYALTFAQINQSQEKTGYNLTEPTATNQTIILTNSMIQSTLESYVNLLIEEGEW